jgi:hypothetical protein
MATDKTQLSALVEMSNPQAIYDEVKIIITAIDPSFDFQYLAKAFSDMEKLFLGEYTGFGKSRSRYYDFPGTAGVFLAMSRLIHGAVIDGKKFSSRELNIGLISALLYSTGFIYDDKKTAEFIQDYCTAHPYFKDASPQFEEILFCAIGDTSIEEKDFCWPQSRLFGKMLGAADILGRMADRYYLERLIFLYHEFQKAGLERFMNELDLLSYAVNYYHTIRNKLSGELQDINRYLVNHFKKRWGIDYDLYLATIEKSIHYLQAIISNYKTEVNSYLRRNVPAAG